jgi:hypothetical protein
MIHKIFISIFFFCSLVSLNAQDLPNAQIWGNTRVKLHTQNFDSSGYAQLSNVLTWANLTGKPTLLSQFTNDLGLGSIYHPLENQRLSTSYSPTFTGLTSSSTTVSEVLIEGTGSSNFSGGSLLFRSGAVQSGDQFGQVTMGIDRGTTGTARFGFQRRTRTNDYTGELLSYSDADGWNFLTADNRTSTGTSSKFSVNSTGALVANRLGINITPTYRFDLLGLHTDTQFRLFSGGGGTPTTQATLFMWASEPATTFTGVGISNNIINDGGGSGGFNRINTNVGGSYMRLLDNSIEFANYNSSGTKTIPFSISGANATFSDPLTVGNASTSSHAITLGQANSNYQPLENQRLSTSNVVTFPRLILNVASGTPPLTVTSTDFVANLNANFIRGLDSNTLAQRAAVNTFAESNTFNKRIGIGGAIDNNYMVNVTGNGKFSTSLDVGTSITSSLLNLTGLASSTTNTEVLSINSNVVKSQNVKDLEIATDQSITLSPFTSDIGGGVFKHILTLDCDNYYQKSFRVNMTNNSATAGTQITFTNMKQGGRYTVTYYNNTVRDILYDSSAKLEDGSTNFSVISQSGAFTHHFIGANTITVRKAF